MAREVNEQEYRLIDRVTQGFQTIANGLGKLKTGMTELNQTAELATKGLGLVVGAARGIGEQVQGIADYETAMRRVIDITQATEAEQRALQQAVQDAQTDLGVTANISADALLRMARDGFSATEAIGALQAQLAFAKAEGRDTGQVIDQLGGVLDAFGERPQIIGQLADQLVAVSRAAGTGTQTLAEGLARVGNTADESNVSVQQTLVYLGALAQRNIESTQAARQLVSILGDFRDPASKAGEALKELGLSGKSFDEVIVALAGNSAAATRVLEALGDTRVALRALLADGGGALRELNTVIAGSEGAAKKSADALKGTFNDSLDRVTAAVDRAKIALGAPILEPLANGLEALSQQLNAAAENGAFDRIGAQLGAFVANAVPQITAFLAEFDFNEAAANIEGFVSRAIVLFNELAKATQIVTGAIGTVYDVIKGGAAGIVEVVADVAGGLTRLSTEFGVPAEELTIMFDDISRGARGLSDEALLSLQHRFRLTAEQATHLTQKVQATATAARAARADLRALAEALVGAVSAGISAIASRWKEFGATVREIPPAAKIAADELFKIKVSAEEAAIGLERLRLSTLSEAVAQLARANLQNTDTFRALVAEVGKSEARIRELTAAQQKAKESTDEQTESTTRATAALRDYADASGTAERSASNLADSNSQVRDSFGNIGAAASSVAVDMGNLSEEYIRQSLAAAGASKSIRGYIDTLNRQMEAGIEQQRQVADRLAQQEKLLRGLDEEAQALDRLRQQYPAIAENELKKLYDAEKRLVELRERKNRVTREGAQIEREAADAANAAAGGLNFGRTGQQQGADQGGGGGSAGGGSSIINVNIAGVVTDDVAREIANRIARFQRLSR